MNEYELTRRAFLASAGAFASAAGAAPARTANPERPPNVLFIICDQMRGDALSCLGSANARTPNLDALAAEGVLAERCFSNSPVCAPSRVSLFSGQYPHEHGKLTNQVGDFIGHPSGSMLGWFHEQGYRLGWVGKNHTCDEHVLEGLDFFVERRREPFRRYINPHVPPWWHGDMYWPEQACYPPRNTADAEEFLRGNKRNEPFFLHVSYFDPHPPYFAPAAWSRQFADMALPDYVPPERLSARLAEQQRALHYDRITEADLKATMQRYYASVAWGVDQQAGRLMRVLDDTGQAENTVVLFLADHGDFMGHFRMVRKAMFLYDHLLHVPMVWRAPGRLPAGRRMRDLVEGVDVWPTLAALCGGPAPERSGRNVADWLRGAAASETERAVVASAAYSDLPEDYFDDPEPLVLPDSERAFHKRVQDRTWQADENTVSVRTREWRFVLNESRPPELYRLDGGLYETENVADRAEYADVRRSLEQRAREAWAF